MSHTPGPWSVSKRATLRVIAHDDNTIASTGCTDNLRDQWEANARLIAAAPDLLAALEKLYRLHCGLDSWHEDAMSNTWASAIAAIAKAKGEA